MKCPHCRRKIKINAEICPYCQHKVKSRPIFIILTVILVILIQVVLIIVLIFTNKVGNNNRVIKYIENNQLEKAVELIDRQSDLQNNQEIDNHMNEYLSDIYQKYAAGNIEYSSVSGIIMTLKQSDICSRYLEDYESKFNNIYNSRINFDNAVNEENQNNYIEALELYEAVISDDVMNYKNAQEKMAEMQENINIEYEKEKYDKLKSISENVDNGMYAKSISDLNTLIDEYPRDKNMIERCIEKRYDTLEKWINSVDYFSDNGKIDILKKFDYITDSEGNSFNILQVINDGEKILEEQFIYAVNSARKEKNLNELAIKDGINISETCVYDLYKNDNITINVDDEFNKRFPEWSLYFSKWAIRYNTVKELMASFADDSDIYSSEIQYIDVSVKYNSEKGSCYWFILLYY